MKIKVTDSYRSYACQVDAVRRKGLYSEGGLGAKPGTSKHGWRLAVDLNLDTKAQAWMRANGKQFGFVEDTPRAVALGLPGREKLTADGPQQRVRVDGASTAGVVLEVDMW